MSAPDPESFGLLAKVITAGGVVATPIVWLWTKLDKKADKHTVNNQLQEVKNEAALQRGHIAKLFDKLEEHARRDEETHREMLKTMSDNHAELLREMGRKADR